MATAAVASPAVPPLGRLIKVRCTRNLKFIQECGYGDQPQQIRTKNKPSPMKPSGSNTHPSQSHKRADVDMAINHELTKGRFISDDLADHLFGHRISTDLVKTILEQFLISGTVQVFTKSKRSKVRLDAKSGDAAQALQDAFKDAIAHGCVYPDRAPIENHTGRSDYEWHWPGFPPKPVNEGALVDFLNRVADEACAAAKAWLGDTQSEAKHRFATPHDKHHAIPLAYEPDGEDMRPDFMLLPREAFSGVGLKTVDQEYINFTAMRMVGESKTGNFRSGLDQVQRYARGIKRAQPWNRFVLALTVAYNKAALMRGDGSGTERIELSLTDGRGCLEFIRILLGVVTANLEEFGTPPAVKLYSRVVECVLAVLAHQPTVTGTYRKSGVSGTSGVASGLSADKQITASSDRDATADVILPSDQAPPRTTSSASSRSKRNYSEIDDTQSTTSKKSKKTVMRRAFIPHTAYGYHCLGIVFTACSIRGRGTTVFAVVNPADDKDFWALKTSWQDVTREDDQAVVLKTVQAHAGNKNVIIPFKTFKAVWNNDEDTTLRTIRAFVDDGIDSVPVEDRVLWISMSRLERPVKFFWGVHDFIRGLRGAILGHQYLYSIGILHRDVSENNVVLARRPGGERGYLIDLDMAIFHPPDERVPPVSRVANDEDDYMRFLQSSSPLPSDATPFRAHRTGTTPYMSFNVLAGRPHTYHDDMESFLYVLLLFFFTYAGPLSKDELQAADASGYTQDVGSGQLRHMRAWPIMFKNWSRDPFKVVSRNKEGLLCSNQCHVDIICEPECSKPLKENWPPTLFKCISKLIMKCWKMFVESRVPPQGGTLLPFTRVDHQQFIDVLDAWLVEFAHLEAEFSPCPFDEEPN